MQKYFTEFLGKSYEESTFKDIENQIRIELNDLIEEKKEIKKELELNQDLLKNLNELSKEQVYIDEEIGLKREELYSLKQAIRKLKEENED